MRVVQDHGNNIASQSKRTCNTFFLRSLHCIASWHSDVQFFAIHPLRLLLFFSYIWCRSTTSRYFLFCIFNRYNYRLSYIYMFVLSTSTYVWFIISLSFHFGRIVNFLLLLVAVAMMLLLVAVMLPFSLPTFLFICQCVTGTDLRFFAIITLSVMFKLFFKIKDVMTSTVECSKDIQS